MVYVTCQVSIQVCFEISWSKFASERGPLSEANFDQELRIPPHRSQLQAARGRRSQAEQPAARGGEAEVVEQALAASASTVAARVEFAERPPLVRHMSTAEMIASELLDGAQDGNDGSIVEASGAAGPSSALEPVEEETDPEDVAALVSAFKMMVADELDEDGLRNLLRSSPGILPAMESLAVKAARAADTQARMASGSRPAPAAIPSHPESLDTRLAEAHAPLGAPSFVPVAPSPVLGAPSPELGAPSPVLGAPSPVPATVAEPIAFFTGADYDAAAIRMQAAHRGKQARAQRRASRVPVGVTFASVRPRPTLTYGF